MVKSWQSIRFDLAKYVSGLLFVSDMTILKEGLWRKKRKVE